MSKTDITFVSKRHLFFFRRYEIRDSLGSNYSIWREYELRLSRNDCLVFEGSPFENCFMHGKLVKETSRGAPKHFIFDSGNRLFFSKFEKQGKEKVARLTLNKSEIALIYRSTEVFGLVENYKILINSQDQLVIDMVLFAFMHDYNWEHIYVGT